MSLTVEIPAQEELHPPPDYDPYYSGLASFVFHFCLFVILPFLAAIVTTEPRMPPAVDVVHVIDTGSETEQIDDLPSGMEGQTPSPEAPPSNLAFDAPPLEAINTDVQVDIPTNVDISPQDVIRVAANAAAQAQQAAAAAASAARDALNTNLGGTPGSAGSGGGGGTGRAGRAARWVLRFNTTNPRDYLDQLGGLGAEIAFPDRNDKYRYFTNLANSPQSTVRTLDNEGRIYWIDEDTFMEVAAELGVSAPVMLAFLPQALEEKMLKLEMARARERGVTEEADIIQTTFVCVRRGGSFDVTVTDQRLAN